MELLYGPRPRIAGARVRAACRPTGRSILLRQVCHSLADAHARGLVHRDIKPANIYVCRMGLDYDFVKVLDFGLVKVRRSRGRRARRWRPIEHGTTGTPAYMAPEIILGESDGRPARRRVRARLRRLLPADRAAGVRGRHADEDVRCSTCRRAPIPPSQRTELPIPRELDDLVLACLEKDPDKRPQNAEVLLEMACGCKSGDGGRPSRRRPGGDAPAGIHGPAVARRSRCSTAQGAP